jgi:hypothetical protein
MRPNNGPKNDVVCSSIFYDHAADIKELKAPQKTLQDSSAGVGILFAIFFAVIFLFSVLGRDSAAPTRRQQSAIAHKAAEYWRGTINGYDKATRSIIDPINVFKKSGALSGKTKNGEKVTILETGNDGWLRIETETGVTGWISPRFVNED